MSMSALKTKSNEGSFILNFQQVSEKHSAATKLLHPFLVAIIQLGIGKHI